MLSCPRCGNTDPRYFAVYNNQTYCRKCIEFQDERVFYTFRDSNVGRLKLDYELTSEQYKIAQKLIKQYENNRNSLVHAVCGAGKTEIVFPLIEHVLKHGGRVGFAIPRKDVVIELFIRIKEAFPDNEVVALYGGNTKQKTGDIIILTMHQIYRYESYFDLLIADEIDAFPFKDNDLLENFFYKAVKGNYVMMSATPNEKVITSFYKKDIFTLSKRFHGHQIPVPKIVVKKGKLQELYILRKLSEYKKEGKKCLIFVPTINDASRLCDYLNMLYLLGDYVHSKRSNSKQIIDNFKNGKLNYLVTTSILERGITIKSLQVIIYNADNYIYNAEVLEQIGGRVGRKKDDPYGDVVFLASSITDEMKKAIFSIQKHNENM